MPRTVTLFVIFLTVFSGCDKSPSEGVQKVTLAPSYEDRLRLQLETAEPGDVILVPEGSHSFTRSLTLNTDNVTIRGAGMDKSILSFKDQIAGAEGLLVNASDFTIEDIAIEDTKGDALKINEGNNIVVQCHTVSPEV